MSDPEVGQVREWTDRLRMRRQGRVTSVDAEARTCRVVTTSGGEAHVTFDMLDPLPEDLPPEPEIDAAEAARRLAALKRVGDVKDRAVRAAVADVYDALRDAEPDTDANGLKIRAGVLVREAAAAAAAELAATWGVVEVAEGATDDAGA